MVDAYKPVDAFDSVTDSTLVLKPKARRGKAGHGRADKAKAAGITANGGYVTLFQGTEPLDSMQLRRQLFEEMWAPLERLVVGIEKQVNSVGVQEVCEFVDTSYTQIESREKGRLAQPFAEIATAVAFAGVNTGDHGKLFLSLQQQLQSQGHHVALLESQYCTSLSSLHRCVLEQMFSSLYADAEAGSKAAQGMFGGSKTIPYDLGLLRIWWADAVARAQSTTGDKRLVVILQDFEGFQPAVIDDFIRVATSYSRDVPIVLVLGLATSHECIHQSLAKASISMLNIERFNLQRSKQCIDAAIHKLFVHGASALSFGAEAYKSLLDQFLLYNFSIAGFAKKLKYAAMDFFYAQPLSVLASMAKPAEAPALDVAPCAVQLGSDQIELIRMQRSVQQFLERRAETDGGRDYVRRALCDDGYFQATVLPQMMRQLLLHRQKYRFGIDVVLAVQEMAPESMQKPIRTLHYYGLSHGFDECPHWKTLLAVVRRMKVSEMEQLLKSLSAAVDRSAAMDWALVAEDGIHIPDMLQGAAETLASPEDAADQEPPASATPTRRVRTRTDMEHRPFALFNSGASDAQLRALETCCEAVEAVFRACLPSYHDVPLNEIFYYRHAFLLDTTFSAQPRAAVQTALGKSHYYIDCDCCGSADAKAADGHGGTSDDQDQHVVPSMHDTSIAYRLHQECGRMINVYDWFLAFASVVEKEPRPAKGALAQSEIQARFMRSVEEMRYLGFIKSTRRKTDHVMRLTWGE
ncbi:Origin recognition complex subunit 3 [Coemansia sp. RSA 552]|nr:Origin recognition complex subunit 3 [Coemansia sp. RSA 552]